MNTQKFEHTSMANRAAEALYLAHEASHLQINKQQKQRIFSTLIMYDRYCDQLGEVIPAAISQAIFLLAEDLGVPPVITYESLILWNPLHDDPLLFSENFPEEELLFYQTHREIELLFMKIYEQVSGIYHHPKIYTSLDDAADNMRLMFRQLAHLIKSMNGASFDEIRPFWNLENHHQKDINGKAFYGPSGAYTCGFIYLDIALGIKPTDLDSYSMDDRLLPASAGNGYISTGEVQEIQKNVETMGTLGDILGSHNEDIISLTARLLQFRKGHMGATRKFVGDVEQAGTGGPSNSREFLESHIESTKNLIARNLVA